LFSTAKLRKIGDKEEIFARGQSVKNDTGSFPTKETADEVWVQISF
jgi:hypothetical protein